MDWYVDNVSGNDSNGGHSIGDAKASVSGVVTNASFTNANSPHNIYVKATGTEYTGNSNCAVFINEVTTNAVISNITIDRYPTDTGSSRPIFSKQYSTSGSNIWGLRCSGFTARNIHFIGKAAGTDSNGLGIIYVLTASSNVLIEYCIFDQRYSYFAIKPYTGHLTGLTMRYCHLYLGTASQETNTFGGIGREASYQVHACSITNCLFENYVYPIDIYRGSSSGETMFIDHNTFSNCARTSNGKVIKMATLFAGDILTITNNITVGNDSVGSTGFYKTGGAVTYTADYNNWYQIDTPYAGTPLPTAAHDIDINPEFQGGSATWADAQISLTNYLAPADTNYGVVKGDSSALCQGAIFVTAYVPPTPAPSTPAPVSISTPSIPGLGALPCFGGSLFNRLKSHLVDDNIYDTSDAAIGITNRVVTFTGNIGDMPVTSLTVYRSYRGEEKIVATVIPDASGDYSFSDKLPHGRAFYHARSSDGKYFSNTMHINSYNIHVWLCAYATELLSLRQQTAQVRQNAKIADGTDFDGNVITTDGYYLTKNFGQYITARKVEEMSRAEYQQLLINVLEAYNLGPSVEALDLICEIFTDRLPSLLWYKNIHGFPTTSAKLRVLGPPSLNYQWDETSVYLYDRHYTVPAGSGVIASGQNIYVYVDGTTSPTTVDNRLSVLASDTRPYRYLTSRTSTISSGLVRVDVDGSNVGVSGELYVTTGRFPVALVGITGSLSPFVSGIPSASLVEHTSNIDLGLAQDDINKSVVFGDITVNYTTDYEYRILGVVHAGASAITGITSCERIDGMGIVSRDVSVHENCGELRINGSQSLDADSRLDLFETLKDVKPAQKFFYVYMENSITGTMEYYGKM